MRSDAAGGEISQSPPSEGMNTHAPKDPTADRFVRELLTTALTFMDALSSLIESFEEGEEPWPGEETGEVLIEMAAGSIRPRC